MSIIKDNILKFSLKSILAGILIALAGVIYVNCENKIVGSMLFSIGLIAVILFEANLYTGKIGYLEFNQPNQIPRLLLMLSLNLISAFIVGIIYRYGVNISQAMLSRYDKSYIRLFLDGMSCGALIYIAVEGYKKCKNILIITLAVMAFILSGAEHCIADAFYYGCSSFDIKGLLVLVIVILGNTCGSILIRQLQILLTNQFQQDIKN